MTSRHAGARELGLGGRPETEIHQACCSAAEGLVSKRAQLCPAAAPLATDMCVGVPSVQALFGGVPGRTVLASKHPDSKYLKSDLSRGAVRPVQDHKLLDHQPQP